ncbi:cell division transport system ATP-binding protein [Thermodesulfovibrio aggregans]|uniref:Cell division ATP-binding protein FtsE n=1 Tax=Thermodesulfovibrio aggregans TaxID=86166 RepID=A0A0U9HRS7_9BACT|nr:cell division ATP-binding protein FtsE [Thermodesulfovibrio aggregans]GAQ95744.1 cell division transport system ATP-binding protein [Thermodesulfovibrio aggregans]
MITFQGVYKYYSGIAVLQNVSFHVDKGELVFITGHSGAGKTTLLKLIFGSEFPDEGEIKVADFELSRIKQKEIPRLRRVVTFVFQDFRLRQDLTVFDNVALPLRVVGERERDIKIKVFDTLKDVALRHKADSIVKTLSGGEQQKIAIARAIITQPQIILADEPTGNLDPESSQDIMNLFKRINSKGCTIVIATHNSELFKNSPYRVLTLKEGKIQ